MDLLNKGLGILKDQLSGGASSSAPSSKSSSSKASSSNPLDDIKGVGLDALFNADFMKKFTSLGSIGELLKKGDFSANSVDAVSALPVSGLDKIVKQFTSFPCWKDMLASAAKAYAMKKVTATISSKLKK